MVTLHGIDTVSGRHLLSLHISSLTDYPPQLDMPSPRFVLFLCADCRSLDDSAVIEFGLRAISQGAVYFCVWGPNCDHIHHLLDAACAQAIPNESDETVIMTTSHDGESLAEALWFAINSAWPASAYEDSCGSLLAVTVANANWNQEVIGWLKSPSRLSEEVT